MILVSLGTQDFPFNRLLEKIDELIEKKVIQEEVIAQTGYSSYVPRHFKYTKFTTFDEFEDLLDQCRILITHGGTGTIVGGLRKKKRIIAVPRLKKYAEHVDDHQTEIINLFSDKNFIIGLEDVSGLEQALQAIETFEPIDYVSGNQKIVSLIDNFLGRTVRN
ncbi:PssE/Cps14G family polysaccharide biosynthesis glycosyltransferase [Paenibacillus caseinilyticus]|uniref:EpsH protein n=1 Tax=Paenibacillus mucilaginosus K02 TaxID=997761 RepID=I0BC54_9BACL|nr:PssE/Cps14G family polysaccharide biosynthesis glycosyltransferase [Paenibacillus mucilaginosus]AFH59951.1 EpsH protein [Paenibacillus mucilaginosus K02]